MIRLAFRLDDPSATSHQEIEARVLDSLARHGLSATFAVIPFRGTPEAPLPLTRERAAAMREAVARGVLDIALHGHSHHDNTAGDRARGHPSEFAGLPPALQLELAASGKALLETVFERPVRGFVPPWNSFDAATLEVLEELRFSHLSSDLHHAPPRRAGLRLLPLTCHLPEVREAVAQARRFARLRPVIVVVMHHYDFPGGDSPVFRDHDEFDALLAWLVAQADVRVQTLSGIAEELTPTASQLGFRHRRLRERLPWRFRHWLPDLCNATRPLYSLIYPGPRHGAETDNNPRS